MISKNTKKYKKYKHNDHRKFNKSKKQNICQFMDYNGGGIMNLVISQKTNTSSKLPLFLRRFNISNYFKSNNATAKSNMYHVIYNYGSPYQIELAYTTNKILLSSNVVNKPHIFLPNINHNLILLIEHPGKQNSRLLWLASYKNRSWERDLLSYLPPSPGLGQTYTYALFIYKLPNEITNIYKPNNMNTTKRKEEFYNLQIYFATNKMIQFTPGLSIYFKVKYDAGNALSFLSGMQSGKLKTNIRHYEKLSEHPIKYNHS